ncbi:hypothetical protein B0H10DRAFT_1952250 [Mycena sp. CBHHK59/15]|nr:hypothetical protein B0H10DRAFT_1952250 [Mycena sp. CBHHK59/15]
MPSTKTVMAISQPQIHQPAAAARAPLTAAEKKEKCEDSQAKKEQNRRCHRARMVNHQEKINLYNAFKSEKAAQVCEEGGRGKMAPELHDEYYEEYNALTEEEKADLVERFKDTKLEALKSYRVGVEGFFCLVRNTPDFFMATQWYFTSRELERYMPLAVRRKWDTGEVGTRLEAFAVAGCNIMNLLHTTKQKVDFMKGEIRDTVLLGLVAITKKEKIQMQYVHYREDIVLIQGIELIGWTADKFMSPSGLSSLLTVLTTLRDVLKNGDCKWVKLEPEDLKARKAEWRADVAAGKKCKHGAMADDAMDEDNDNNSNSNVDEQVKSASSRSSASAIIEEPDDPRTKRTPKADKGNKATRKENKMACKEKGKSAAKGPRHDDVICGVASCRAATKSRAIISEDEDDDDDGIGVHVTANATPASMALGPTNAEIAINPTLV